MDQSNANPIFVGFLFVVRCLIPLLILFGISWVLRRLGLVEDTTHPSHGGPSNGNH